MVTKPSESLENPRYDYRRFLTADGCEYSASCFTCLLPYCRYERGPGEARSELLAEQIRERAAAGQSAVAIGAAVGRSFRSVYRIAQRFGITIGHKGLPATNGRTGRPRHATAIPTATKARIVARCLAGERTADLAQETGVSVESVQKWVRKARREGV